MSDPTIGQVLEQDHHTIDAQLAAFADALAQGRVDADSLAAGSNALRHHIWVEEELHFPPLRAAGLMGPVLVMLREHGQIWDLLDRADSQVAGGAPVVELQQTWHALADVLTAHNSKEEQILYPSGDEILDEQTAQSVRTALQAGVTPPGWVCEMAGRA